LEAPVAAGAVAGKLVPMTHVCCEAPALPDEVEHVRAEMDGDETATEHAESEK